MVDGQDETVSLDRTPADRRRDQAITACCLAASVLGDPSIPGARQGRALMSCLGVLGAVYPMGAAPSMKRFREGLRGALGDLLPADLNISGIADLELLDAKDRFSDEAEDLCGEFLVPAAALKEHWPWQRVAAEQEERRLFEMLRRLPDGEYTRLRAELVDRPTGDLRTLRGVWDSLLPQFFEPITDLPGRQLHGWFFACPECRWPMRVLGTRSLVDIRCESHARRGVTYTCRVDARGDGPPVLRPTGKRAKPVVAQPVTNQSFAVSRVAWRYLTLAGLLECELRDHALKLKAEVVMWPHRDRYDLAITSGARTWLVDAKAWASPIALGEALRGRAPAAPGLVVVIPDHQRPSLHLLRELVDGCGYRVETARGLKAELSKASRSAA